MTGAGETETVSYVVVKMTAKEAKRLAEAASDGAARLREEAVGRTSAAVNSLHASANALETLVSAIGVGLAQVPPS